jgi:metallothiol transferase
MFSTHGLNHITIYVQDLARSLRFYTEILRMRLVRQGPDYAYLESGSTWFAISHQPSLAKVQAQKGVNHLALTVRPEDFDAAVEHLRRHEVPIVREPILRGVGRTVNFLDPDGLQWEFHSSNLAERLTVIAEMEQAKRGSKPVFDLYAFADYSGAESLAAQRKHIVLAAGDGQELHLHHHTRESLYTALCDLLLQAHREGKRVLFGVDHSYSFPSGFYEAVTGRQQTSWDDLLDLLPPHAKPREWAAAINALLVEKMDLPLGSAGPFWGANFKPQERDPKFPHHEVNLPERRLVELRDRRLKPIYKLGGAGSVGLQSLFGIPQLARLRRFCREHDIPLHAWPFDGWELPANGHVLAEVYPTLYNHGTRTDENDAAACVTHLAACDAQAKLLPLFQPELPPADRARAQLEGWVLGIM